MIMIYYDVTIGYIIEENNAKYMLYIIHNLIQRSMQKINKCEVITKYGNNTLLSVG